MMQLCIVWIHNNNINIEYSTNSSNKLIEQKISTQMPCHYYPHIAEPAYIRFSLTPELMTVVLNMALIPQCRA